MRRSPATVVAERLRVQLPELEATVLARVESPRSADPEYPFLLRSSVRGALRYALEAVELGKRGIGPVPTELLAQARVAARSAIGVDAVLRPYFAVHTVLVETVIREAREEDAAGADDLQALLRTQAGVLDRVLAAVSEEHQRAAASSTADGSAQARRLRTIARLLDDELTEAGELRYELSASHVALFAAGPEVERALRSLADELDCALLLAWPEETQAWAWLGSRRGLSAAELCDRAASVGAASLRMAVGEAGEGITGWRRSHRQARAAWPIARRGDEALVRYADVAILASVMQDGMLVDSLRRLYLDPLETAAGNRGQTLRETLRAYFAADRSAASAAALLGVSRQAVSRRLRTVEARIGRPLSGCASELEAALRLRDIVDSTPV